LQGGPEIGDLRQNLAARAMFSPGFRLGIQYSDESPALRFTGW
jgi:hypothetical protein